MKVGWDEASERWTAKEAESERTKIFPQALFPPQAYLAMPWGAHAWIEGG
jgi:hypothetical protein